MLLGKKDALPIWRNWIAYAYSTETLFYCNVNNAFVARAARLSPLAGNPQVVRVQYALRVAQRQTATRLPGRCSSARPLWSAASGTCLPSREFFPPPSTQVR